MTHCERNEGQSQKKTIILGETYNDNSDITIRGRGSTLFKNPSLGGTYTVGCRRPIRGQEAWVQVDACWWDVHTISSTIQKRGFHQ